jgi:hypothetical protein
MKFELRRVRTSNKPGEQGTTIVSAKAIATVGAKPDQTRLDVTASITITAAEARGAKSSLIPGKELAVLRLLMENAVKAVREHEAAAKVAAASN